MALYNIPIGFKIFAVINLHQRNEVFTVSNLHICNYYLLLYIKQGSVGSKSYPLQALGLLTSTSKVHQHVSQIISVPFT